MRLYQAGIMTSNFNQAGRVYARLDENEKTLRNSVEWNLESYHYIHKPTAVRRIREEGMKVFLDSGAFSAYTQGVKIDLGKYCDYCHKNADIIDFPSVLDAIGTENSYKDTYKNQMEMESRGVNPLPCFHFGEPTEVLDHYVANYDYITIGGMVPISTKQLTIWLDRIWEEHLTDSEGTPLTKVHGFGLTSLPLMQRYPWFSVDSSTWVQWAANGMLLLPKLGMQVNVSDKSSSRKMRNQHYDTYTQQERDVIDQEFDATGIDPERLRTLYYSRWAWNCWAFPEYMKLRGGGLEQYKPETMRLF